MPRHGQQKVRTGCLTCKKRKVKCDETHPDCRRCTSTGRNCDRYRAPPTGSYSWDEVLLRAKHVPSIVLGAEFLDPPGLTYFTRVVASELAGPFKSQLWTYELPQATYSEPALRHAVLAVASLYQNFGHLRIGSSSKPSNSHEAISHYNSAIRHLTTPNNLSLETVLLACILFVCIEFLSSNTEAAVLHATHGMSLVGSTQPKSDILPVLRHLAIFPHFFSLVVPEMPTFDSGGWSTMDAAFTTLAQAQQSLDSLMYRSVRMLRTTDHHRNGTGPKLQPLESARLDQKKLEDDLDHWLAVFHTFRRDLKPREKHELCLLLLEIRWLVTRTWTSTYLSPDELIYDAHHGSFSRILELAAQAKVQQGRAASARSKFSFEMGFAPLLYFVVLKCRCFTLRVNALALMEALSFSRESLWDYATMRAIGTKIIEKEHGIDALSSGTAVRTNSQSCQYPLPAELRRVRDSFMAEEAEEAEEVLGTSEVKILRKKITLLFKSETGTLQTVHDWITIG